jgi:peptide/nickel transport system permease protein
MYRYLFRRFGFLIITIFLTSLIIFTITQFLPGDTARVILGREAGEQAVQSLRQELGLNDPAPIQYIRWLGRFITGDWGRSFSTKGEIRPLVLERLRNSLRLALVTALFAIPLALVLGIIAGLNESKVLDHVINIGSLSVVGLPEFVTGLILIQVLAFRLKLLPANSSVPSNSSFTQALPMLILPALTATLVLLAYIARMTRSGVIEEFKKTYVRTADLKGLPRRTVIFKHVLPNALLPTITIIALSFGWLISGLIVIENVFNYPGIGRLMIFAIDRHDIPLIQALSLITVLIFALANLAADLLYAYLNPRIRLG